MMWISACICFYVLTKRLLTLEPSPLLTAPNDGVTQTNNNNLQIYY